MYEVQETPAGFKVLCNGVPMTVTQVRDILPDAILLHDHQVINFLRYQHASELIMKLRGKTDG